MSTDEAERDRRRDVIEPGSPRLENVIMVLLGVASTLAVVFHLVTLFG